LKTEDKLKEIKMKGLLGNKNPIWEHDIGKAKKMIEEAFL